MPADGPGSVSVNFSYLTGTGYHSIMGYHKGLGWVGWSQEGHLVSHVSPYYF